LRNKLIYYVLRSVHDCPRTGVSRLPRLGQSAAARSEVVQNGWITKSPAWRGVTWSVAFVFRPNTDWSLSAPVRHRAWRLRLRVTPTRKQQQLLKHS